MPSRRQVVAEITASARWGEQVAVAAERLGRRVADVAAEAAGHLDGLVAVQRPIPIRAFQALTGSFYRRAWRLDVDVDALERLRPVGATRSLAFLPTHRSYADSMILNSVLWDHGFGRNTVVGGDNLAFWPIGPLGRRSGVIFIRRTVGDDPAYKLALHEYLGFLAATRVNVEWYLEGGRSRTGKLRDPRYGMLTYLVDAVADGLADDVALVPTSITYDRVPERAVMAAEEDGQAKSPEGVRWFVDYARSQSHPAGTAYVRFGAPMSLREHLAAGAATDENRRATMQRVAFEVFASIDDTIPVTAVSLVALALLGVDRSLTMTELHEQASRLRADLATRRVPSADLARLDSIDGLRRVVDRLVADGIVARHDDGLEPVVAIDEGQRLAAAYYANSGVHWFVARALVELAVMQSRDRPAGTSLREAATEAATALHELLAFEFFFRDRATFLEELTDEAARMAPEAAAGPDADALEVLAAAGFLVAPAVLRPFLEAIFVVADRLVASDPSTPVDPATFIDECAAAGRQYVRQGRLRDPESVSHDLYGNALQLAKHRRLADPSAADMVLGRQALLDEVRAALDALDALGSLDRQGS